MVSRRHFIRSMIASMLFSLGFPLLARIAYMTSRGRSGGSSVVLPRQHVDGIIKLPLPRLKGRVSVEEAIANRRSIRDYTDEPIELWELAQILWAAYGITETMHGFRASPSAGATYPLELYVVVSPKGIRSPWGFLEPGSYHYDPHTHSLRLVRRGNLTWELYEAALRQRWVLEAKANIVFTAVFERTMAVYGRRGERYVWIEVGHAGQNVYLQATSLGLATVAIGAFYDDMVREIIGAPSSHKPAYIMPLARPAWRYRLDPDSLKAYVERRRRESTGGRE